MFFCRSAVLLRNVLYSLKADYPNILRVNTTNTVTLKCKISVTLIELIPSFYSISDEYTVM